MIDKEMRAKKETGGVTYWGKSAVARAVGIAPGSLDHFIGTGDIQAPTHSIGRRKYYTPEQVTKIRQFFKDLAKRNERHTKYWSRIQLVRALGMSEIVFRWHEMKGNIPAPASKCRGRFCYSPVQAEKIQRFFTGYNELKRTHHLLYPGMQKIGMDVREIAYVHNHPEILDGVPVIIYGQNKRNRYYTIPQLELIKRKVALARADKK